MNLYSTNTYKINYWHGSVETTELFLSGLLCPEFGKALKKNSVVIYIPYVVKTFGSKKFSEFGKLQPVFINIYDEARDHAICVVNVHVKQALKCLYEIKCCFLNDDLCATLDG